MPKKKRSTPIGVANAVTISRVGVQHLDQSLRRLNGPYYALWNHNKTDIETLWPDGSLRDAVAEFQGQVTSTTTGTRRTIIVPLVVRNGQLLDPAVFASGNRVYVWGADAFADLMRSALYEPPYSSRAHVFDYPAAPTIAPPTPVTVPGLSVYGHRNPNAHD